MYKYMVARDSLASLVQIAGPLCALSAWLASMQAMGYELIYVARI